MDVISRNSLRAVAVLADPVRRQIYDIVAQAADAMSRDAVARASGVPRSTAVFHLDRLVESGLLSVEYRRLSGRTGPGAGRPSKLYRATDTEVAASVPERHYELAGELLASAAERADRERTPMKDAVAAQARELGAAIGRDSRGLEAALTACGYDPQSDGHGGVVLCNCPFHALVERHTDLVCNANLSLVGGIVEGADDPRTAHLIPHAGHCCVEIHAGR